MHSDILVGVTCMHGMEGQEGLLSTGETTCTILQVSEHSIQTQGLPQYLQANGSQNVSGKDLAQCVFLLPLHILPAPPHYLSYSTSTGAFKLLTTCQYSDTLSAAFLKIQAI